MASGTGYAFQLRAEYKVKVGKVGRYKVKYYVILYCDATDCAKAEDFVSLSVKKQQSDYKTTQIHSSDSISDFNRWIEHSYLAESDSQGNLNLDVTIGRSKSSEISTFLGVDGLDFIYDSAIDPEIRPGSDPSNLLPILLGTFIPAAVIAIALVGYVYYRTKRKSNPKEDIPLPDFIDDSYGMNLDEVKTSQIKI